MTVVASALTTHTALGILSLESKLKAFVFDLDGTLFETTAQVREDAEGLDKFVEFLDNRQLKTESHPLPLLQLARDIDQEGHHLFILTARNSLLGPSIR